ncbi:MAG: acyl--CoA ligase [Prevotella sp.]|nr:acyl--CoA ligase [Prevotella sp.]
MTLEDYLAQDAAKYPEKTAVICDGQSYTYARLWQLVQQRAADIPGGKVIPFRSSQTVDFLVTYLAIHLAGSVAAPLEKDIPDNLFAEVSERLSSNTVPDGSADVLYTTGTTGKSKGVIISHRTIVADAENLIAGQGFSHDLVFVIHGPLNHIGSLSKIYPCILLGATLHILNGLRDADVFFEAFQAPGKYATFFVPANIRFLLSFDEKRFAALADRLDFVESGGAPLSHADMLQLCEILPRTRLYNTYASTETGIIATYNYNDGRCLAACLGRPMPHSRVFITDDGKIACQGDTLMSGYIGDPELTATVLRDDTVYMSDFGQIDEEGMLHIGGRESEVINVGGYKVAPTEVEDVAMSIEGVQDCICISAEHRIMGKAVKLLVVMKEGAVFDKKTIARYIAARLEPYKVPQLYEEVQTIARTYNGKLDRKFYK